MGQCPSTFAPYQGACVRECPDSQFTFLTSNNQPRCVSTTDSTKQVNLKPVTTLLLENGKPLPTMESLRQSDPGRYALYKTESDRVDAELQVILSEVDKKKQIDDAFKALQQAENVRDESPEAYGKARLAYYTMVQGPEWVEIEKQRVAKVEVEPEISKYRMSFDSLTSRQQNQQRTQDIMRSVQEGVLTMKDDVEYTTGIFKEQIDNLKNEINIERRGREKPVSQEGDFYKWVDALLNLFIIAGLIYAVFVLWKKLRPVSPPTYAPIAIQR
jgi:hypothetical protein